MTYQFHPKYPSVDDLKKQAARRMPAFAMDYLIGGCHDEIGVKRNREDIQSVKLRGELLKPSVDSNLDVELFGQHYRAPFGIAPIGLQGLMWPRTPEILAKAAAQLDVPFILSTVTSANLESIAEISEGKAWFQLYNPTDDGIRNDLLNRVEAAGYPVLVVTVDVPTFGYRPRDIRNSLAMPPKMTLPNVLQMLARPNWLWATAKAGKPEMKTLKPYMPKNMPTDELAAFMNKTVMGAVDMEALKVLRDRWKGPLVVKGLINEKDVHSAIELGADAVVISNHGGRQIDIGESPIEALMNLSPALKQKIKIFMDGGLNSGSNIASALAAGADFTFSGRAFVYGVAALGDNGGTHTINMLSAQLKQVLQQLKCRNISDLPGCLVAG